MHDTLVQHSQNDIDRRQRGENQYWLTRERILKCLRSTLEPTMHRGRHTHLPFYGGERIDCLSERHIGSQVEGNCDRRKLSLVRNRNRSLRHFEVRKRTQRYLDSARRLNVDTAQSVRTLAKTRIDLHNDVI